jgi:hypothetical protein
MKLQIWKGETNLGESLAKLMAWTLSRKRNQVGIPYVDGLASNATNQTIYYSLPMISVTNY